MFEKIMFVLVSILLLGAVFSEPGGVSSTIQSSSTYTPTVETEDFQSGWVYNTDLNLVSVTSRWVGMYGDFNAGVVLSDSSANEFYRWTVSNDSNSCIFASTAASITWASLAAAGNSDMPAWLTTANASDNWTSTFISTKTFNFCSFNVASVYYVKTRPTDSNFYSYSLKEGSSLVWSTVTLDANTNFAGGTNDYQLLLPEDGSGGNTTKTTYYIWAALP